MNINRLALSFILALSAIAILFLTKIIYFNNGSDSIQNEWVTYLPFLNALLNSLSALCLISGRIAIAKKKQILHIKMMISAFIFSTLFLISYIVYHYIHGDTPFTGQGMIRPIYFIILISHILLSIAALPLVLYTFFLAINKQFDKHKSIARWTFPIWLYVSITGVIIFVLLKTCG